MGQRVRRGPKERSARWSQAGPTSHREPLPIYLFLFIRSFLAVTGLRCRVRARSGCSKHGLLSFEVCVLLTVGASLVGEHRL